MDRSAAPWRALDPDQENPATPGGAPASVAASGHLGGSWLAFAALAVSGVFAVGTFALLASGDGGLEIDGGVELGAVDPSLGRAGGSGAHEIVVEVAGAVARPGVYRLPEGTRLGEAIDLAGGYGPRVDAARAERELNLAGALADGDRILVPSRDDPTESSPTDGSGPPGAETNDLVNLNTATQAELEALPGIGPVTASKIIAAREDQPFTSIDELRGRGIVGEKTFADLADLITVR
jgi:competence protein ComEA